MRHFLRRTNNTRLKARTAKRRPPNGVFNYDTKTPCPNTVQRCSPRPAAVMQRLSLPLGPHSQGTHDIHGLRHPYLR